MLHGKVVLALAFNCQTCWIPSLSRLLSVRNWTLLASKPFSEEAFALKSLLVQWVPLGKSKAEDREAGRGAGYCKTEGWLGLFQVLAPWKSWPKNGKFVMNLHSHARTRTDMWFMIAYIHACMHAYIPTYIHTIIQYTYVHMYILT